VPNKPKGQIQQIQRINKEQMHTALVYSVRFSPDGKRIISCSLDNTVRLWDAFTGKPIGQPLTGHTD